MPPNGWNEYQKLVLQELKDRKYEIQEIKKDLAGLRQSINSDFSKLNTEMVVLKVKVAALGATAGLVTSAAANFFAN